MNERDVCQKWAARHKFFICFSLLFEILYVDRILQLLFSLIRTLHVRKKNITGPPFSWFWSLSVGNRILLFNLLFIIFISVRKEYYSSSWKVLPCFDHFVYSSGQVLIHSLWEYTTVQNWVHILCICIWRSLYLNNFVFVFEQFRACPAAVQNCATFQNWHLWVTCKGKSSLIWNIPLCKNLTWQKCVQDTIQSEVSIEIGGYASKKLPTLQGIHINRSSTQLTQLASLLPHKHKSQIHNMPIIVKEQFACFKLTALEQKDPWNHPHGFLFFWIKIRI